MVNAINEYLSILPDWLHVLLISAIPVIELRGAIPYGMLLLKMPAVKTLLIAICGSMLPSPFVLYFGKWLVSKMTASKFKLFSKFGQRLTDKSVAQAKKIEGYAFWGIVMFVGIPLPGTGVWTGSLIAAMLGLKPKNALLAILIGTTIAGIIVTLLVGAGIMIVTG